MLNLYKLYNHNETVIKFQIDNKMVESGKNCLYLRSIQS